MHHMTTIPPKQQINQPFGILMDACSLCLALPLIYNFSSCLPRAIKLYQGLNLQSSYLDTTVLLQHYYNSIV